MLQKIQISILLGMQENIQMLKIATEEEIKNYTDQAYELAMDPTRCGYPVYYDGMKTKDEFIQKLWRSYREPNRELLLFIHEDRVEGFIQFYYLEEDNYLQTEGFSIANHTATALEEFIEYCGDYFPGYELYFGFPADNQEAVSYLREKGWFCLEQSWNQVLYLKNYQLRPESLHVKKVTKENFEDFRTIHSQYDSKMYWNCQRIYNALDEWNIYLYYREEKPLGTIFYVDEEIFGLCFVDDKFDREVYDALLTRAANDHKERGLKNIVFFEDADSPANEIGFQRVGKYLCFTKQK